MSSIIEIGSTVWLPDDEDMFLPGKVTSIDGDNAVVAVIDSPDDEEITAAVNIMSMASRRIAILPLKQYMSTARAKCQTTLNR